MTFEEFSQSVKEGAQPPGLPLPLAALWTDARGDWDGAHNLIDDEEGPIAAWVHAYLHRKEGDAGNAAYWYSRAGRPVCAKSLEAEWREIAIALLG